MRTYLDSTREDETDAVRNAMVRARRECAFLLESTVKPKYDTYSLVDLNIVGILPFCIRYFSLGSRGDLIAFRLVKVHPMIASPYQYLNLTRG